MAISLVAVAGKITAAIMNQVITAVNGIALAGIVPTSVVGGTVTANGKVTFSNQASVSLNGVFSGTYDNYRLVLNSSARSAASTINVRMRSAGADYTTGNYQWVRGYDTGTSRTVASSTSGTAAPLDIGASSNQTFDGYMDVFGPALGTYTTAAGLIALTSNGTPYQFNTMFTCYVTQAFDGITIYPISGTFTGTVRVYGYNNLT